jgi:predicted protein tyrosine phosphatase
MILFVCSLGKLRSRTAELLCLFGGLDARACGTAPDALAPVSDSLLRIADLVVCMETGHHRALRGFQHYGSSELVTLGIEDRYDRLEPELVTLLCYHMRFHAPHVADAMERGKSVLANLPGYVKALGTQTSDHADNPAFSAFPH